MIWYNSTDVERDSRALCTELRGTLSTSRLFNANIAVVFASKEPKFLVKALAAHGRTCDLRNIPAQITEHADVVIAFAKEQQP